MLIPLSPPMEYINSRNEDIDSTHEFRGEFGRDRDRIFLSRVFRRLNEKMHMYAPDSNIRARSRLMHSYEVALLSKTVSRALNLDQDLSEAIAYGHDVGHAPFGNGGEVTLNYIMNNCNIDISNYKLKEWEKGFKHNFQSIRNMVDLERNFRELSMKGLNLTTFTLYGILKHADIDWGYCKCKKIDNIYQNIDSDQNNNFDNNNLKYNDSDKNEKLNKCYRGRKIRNCKNSYITGLGFYKKYLNSIKIKGTSYDSWSFEAMVVKLCNEIAKRHHDLEDSLLLGIMSEGEAVEIMELYFGNIISGNNGNDYSIDRKNFAILKNSIGKMQYMSDLSRFVYNFYVNIVIFNCTRKIRSFINQHSIEKDKDSWAVTYKEICEKGEEYFDDKVLKVISFTDDLLEADNMLKKYLKNRITNSLTIQRMNGHGSYIVRKLFKAYLNNPRQLPDKTIYTLYRACHDNDVRTSVIINRKMKEESAEVTKAVGKMRNAINIDRHQEEFRPILMRVICDYIAGMTDAYAIREYNLLYRKS